MSDTSTEAAPLTVVLVHGAFADSSSWNGVVERLQAAGVRVTAPPNPLRGIAHDSAYVESFIKQIPGPVLAVGHSYGGAVISNAATDAENVVGLVFVAAFAPDEGERLGEVTPTSKDAVLGTALVPLQYPTGNGEETAVEFAIDPEKLHDVFAADLRPSRPRSWPRPSGPWPSSASRSRRARPPGGRCRPGPCSPAGTSRPAPTWSGRWPSAPGRRSPRSRAPT